MTGLYRKALSFRKPDVQPDRAPDRAATGADDGISAEERAQIAGRIDAILAESRIPVSPQALSYKPKRHGALLPIVSNIVILAVFGCAGFIIYRLLNHQEQYIATGQAVVQGAESQLIAAMKRQAQQQLESKDQAILDAQSKLQSLSQEEQRIRSESQSAVKAREQQLMAEYDRKLAQEKDALQKQGLSADARSARLRAFEEVRRQEIDRQLAEARRQAQQALAEKQKSIAVLVSQYQGDLETARQQREKIQSSLAQSGPAQTAATGAAAASTGDALGAAGSAASSNAALPGTGTPGAAAATQDLARLGEQKEKEQLILDQMLAGYSRVEAALQRKDYAEAQNGLDSLRALVQDPSVMLLPSIQKRSPVELFLINSLSDLVASRRTSLAAQAAPPAAAPPTTPPAASEAVSPDAAAASEADRQLHVISQLVAQGDARMKAGDFAGAREAYLEAIGTLPSVSQGYRGLESIRASLDRQDSAQAMNGFQQANLFFQAGNFRSSVEQYRVAVGLLLKDQALAGQLTDNIMNAGYHVLAAEDLAALGRFRTDAQRRQAALKRIEDLRNQYLAYAALAPRTLDPASAQSLATLLQAKIVLRQILDSEPIRSKYPQLAGQIEEYFAALEQEGKQEGRNAAISELSAALGVNASSGGSARDPLAALLDGLEALLSD